MVKLAAPFCSSMHGLVHGQYADAPHTITYAYDDVLTAYERVREKEKSPTVVPSQRRRLFEVAHGTQSRKHICR